MPRYVDISHFRAPYKDSVLQGFGADAAVDAFFVKDADGYTVIKDEQTKKSFYASYTNAGVTPVTEKDGVSFMYVQQGATGVANLINVMSAAASRTPDAAFFIGRTAIKPDGLAKPLVSTGDIAQIRSYAANPDFFWIGGARPALDTARTQAGMGAGTVLLIAGGVALAYYLIAGQKKSSYGYSPNRRRRRH